MNDSNARSTKDEEIAPEGTYGSPIGRPKTASFSTRSRVFCSLCQEIVGLVTAAEAAAEYNTDLQDIRFLLDRRDIHAVPRDPAVISICRNSLIACFDSRQTRLLDSHFEMEAQGLIGG